MDVDLEAKKLLEDGYHYKEVSDITGLSIPQVMRRKRKHCINMQDAFKNRLCRDGIPDRSPNDDKFCAWFVGFFDGEGTFQFWYRIKQNSKQFVMFLTAGLRDDDRSVFDYIISQVGGTCMPYTPKRGTSNPSVKWRVECVKELQEVFIPLFDKFPPRSKKLQQYEIWKEFIFEKYINTLGGRTTFKYSIDFSNRFIKASQQIKDIRNYDRRY